MKKEIKVMDTSFRDGFQSIFGAKVLIEDFLPALKAAVDAGIRHFETAGGARFQAPIFFCNENAFETMDKMREAVGPDVTLQSLARGVNVVGLNSQPRDVIDLHAKMFAKHGINVIRNFDALNDVNNLIDSANSIKKHGLKHEVTITMMELPYGCEGAHDVAFYERVLRNILDSGLPFDSLAFKDASGTSNPRKVYATVKMAREILGSDAHIRFHSHETAGTGLAAYLAALDGGADGIDLAMKPVSGGTGQPDIISMWHALKGTDYDLCLDIKKVMETEEIFKECMKDYPLSPISLAVNPILIQAPLPGGATATTVNQLKDMGMLDKFPKLIENMKEVVERGGFATSVTPVSQFYAQQSFLNAISEHPWEKVNPGYAKMLLGYFGKTPCKPDPELIKWAEEKLTAEAREKAKKGIEEKIKSENSQLSAQEFEQKVNEELSKIKVEPTTEKVVDINDRDEEKGIAAAERRLKAAGLPVTDENLFIAAACKDGNVDKGIDFLLGKGVVSVDKSANKQKTSETASSSNACTVTINNKKYAVKINGDKATVNGKEYSFGVTEGVEEVSSSSSSSGEGVEIKAPMPATVLRIGKSKGDSVEENEEILVIEAMKMETPIKSPKAGTITSISVSQGDKVQSGQVMVTVG